MRAAVAFTIVLVGGALMAAPAQAAAPPAGWKPDIKAARTFALGRAGAVSFHVRTERGRWSFDADRGVASASVIKAMLLVAYLNRAQVSDRPLHAADRRLLDPMIRRSDNAAATRVRDIVGDTALRRVAGGRT
jgi:hypothetical protein